MRKFRSLLSPLKPTRLGILFAVLIGFGVGFWQWGQPPALATLPLLGRQGGGKDKESSLISAMKFVKVPKGSFWMSKDGKNAQVQMEITEEFELAAFAVTQEQWQAVMGDNRDKALVEIAPGADVRHFPVVCVSWKDVQKFVQKLNAREKGKGWDYRLPSEVEWEYACRGAAQTKEDCSFDFYFEKPSNDLSSKEANFAGFAPVGNAAKGPYLGRPTKVGSYAPNKLGLYDMHGNVWQWCSELYYGKGTERVIRGGSWGSYGIFCRAAERNSFWEDMCNSNTGFRLARVPSRSNQHRKK